MENQERDLQREEQSNKLYKTLEDYIPSRVIKKKNKAKAWLYGYNPTYDVVVISKDGTVGEIILVQNLVIALPEFNGQVDSRSKKKNEQYWERKELPESLSKIRSMSQWNKKSSAFKDNWVDYIESEFDHRELGHWHMENGVPVYKTGSNYMYLQWSAIDVGYPEFREANRILFIFWEACKADTRCYGMQYLKIRRSGFSFMASSESVNTGTLSSNSRIGILSKTGADAKKMFTDKVVPISSKYPFFFKPMQDGMDKPKTELSYRVPASKITKRNMHLLDEEEIIEGLDTTIDWNSTDDNSYDGEKLLLLVHDESGKWLKPNSITVNLRVTRTCLRLGRKIIGKCMMGSTSNALDKGGEEFKKIYYDSSVLKRNSNGQTKSGLYSLFIPMEYNMEGFIDRHGQPILRTPERPVMGIDGELINIGAIDFWENEADGLKGDSDALNEFYRQYPRTESHAFRDESKDSLFNLAKIYQQIDYNDALMINRHVTRGKFSWRDGIKDSEVIFSPDATGRFYVSWIPEAKMRNNVITRQGKKYPGNEEIGAFGCDSYDISGTVGGGGSNGALHGSTGFHVRAAPINQFFLEYIARPQTAEIFFEDVLMACVFYGMPILVENNKPRLLYHLKNRGYRGFSINRPDKPYVKLSKTEMELGGIPNSSEDVKQAHAASLETYIEKYVGLDVSENYRDPDEMGWMPFNRTLKDWARFDINNRTKYDASISSGLSRMAVNKHIYHIKKEKPKLSINFATYSQSGTTSKINK